MLLGGDLGGTKTLLALAEADGDGIRIVRQQRYASANYASFDALLADFLADRPPVTAACFGVAGPTDAALAAALEADSTEGLSGFAPRPDYRPLTKFENRGLRLGHGVWDIIFKKR